jgi:NDMA-dependent alcohol dehydrogenase
MIKTSAAVCRNLNEPWTVETVEIDPPGPRDVSVKMVFAGLCHSDEHLRLGDVGAPPEVLEMIGVESLYPVIGGHEGAGIVQEVGAEVTDLKPGDRVVTIFIPSCGHCFWCASGRQHLCDLGAATLAGPMMSDGTWRHRLGGQNLNRMGQVGSFTDLLVCDARSLVKISEDVPMDIAAVVSCGIATGFGSSANRGNVRPGEIVVVVGCGGVGHGALLGAMAAGAETIVAVDPIPFKREHAQKVGATHGADSMASAQELVSELTNGRMADIAVLTPGLLKGEMLAEALPLISKGGRVVCTAVAPWDAIDAKVSLFDLAMSDKAILGTLYGSTSPRVQIPRLLDLYRAGKLPLDGIVSRRYSMADVNDGYSDMDAGNTIRGVIEF